MSGSLGPGNDPVFTEVKHTFFNTGISKGKIYWECECGDQGGPFAKAREAATSWSQHQDDPYGLKENQ